MLNEVYNRRIIELAGTIPRIGRLAGPDADVQRAQGDDALVNPHNSDVGRLPGAVAERSAQQPATERVLVLLLGLGLRELSMAPTNLPRVKPRIRNLDMIAATRRAEAIMDQSDAGRIAAMLAGLGKKLGT